MADEKDSISKDRITIILHSGSYDRVSNALSLAIVGLSMGMEVYVLLTYEVISRFMKGHLEDGDKTDPELLKMMQKGIREGKFHTIEEKLEIAHEMGLKLYACNTAMETIGISLNNLTPQVSDTMGLTTFLTLARRAAVNWYI